MKVQNDNPLHECATRFENLPNFLQLNDSCMHENNLIFDTTSEHENSILFDKKKRRRFLWNAENEIFFLKFQEESQYKTSLE